VLRITWSNRSALEWIIDPVSGCTDKRNDITNDPNQDDDEVHRAADRQSGGDR